MSTTEFITEPGKQELVISRVFEAPLSRVWKLWTDPKLMPEWWGPKILSTTVEKMDLKPGGVWRIIQRDPKGNVFAFHGVYHDIVPQKRLVYTFEFEGMPGHVSLETGTFEEHDGKTTITGKSVFQTVEDRDGMLNSGMEKGATETLDRFENLLSSLPRESK